MGRVHLGQGCRRRVKRSELHQECMKCMKCSLSPKLYFLGFSRGGLGGTLHFIHFIHPGREARRLPHGEARRTLRGSAHHRAPRCPTVHHEAPGWAVVRLPLRPCPNTQGAPSGLTQAHLGALEPGARRLKKYRPVDTWCTTHHRILKNPINHGIFSKLLLGNIPNRRLEGEK